MVMHKKTFTVDVNDELSEAFTTQCDERGYTKYRALEGAMRAFISLPDEVQVSLMKSNNRDAHNIIYQSLRDIELTRILKALTDEQRTVLIETSKEVTKRLFPKKKGSK